MGIRLIVADDHEVARAGLVCALDSQEIDIVGQASNGCEAVALAIETQPDVALIDVHMHTLDGLSALREIREKAPDVAVVMLSMNRSPTYMGRAISMGAADYVFKSSETDEILDAIRRAAQGLPLPPDAPMFRLREFLSRRERVESLSLTKRQVQVLRFVGLGLENSDIARSLNLTVDTVKEHVRCVLRELDLKDRTQAAVWAIQSGFMREIDWDRHLTPSARD